ncbi:TetR/AcrR family transcriptional regulator [Sphingobacterium sp. MYb382]|uniref:TetR/AcrR family transcriptional regulator n=1 Tax=Sphingobacterium sp. MYb382 TaxID=2745278 RepID=UPI00309D82BA
MVRKVVDGPLRNKIRTQQRLIAAVGEIIHTKGYMFLGVNSIARQADLDKKLIYRYFGSFDGLIVEYLLDQDYWLNILQDIDTVMLSDSGEVVALLKALLNSFFDRFIVNSEYSTMMMLELVGNYKVLRNLNTIREEAISVFFERLEPFLKKQTIPLCSVFSLLIGAINFQFLYTHGMGRPFFGLSVKTTQTQQSFKELLEGMVNQCLIVDEKAQI